MQFTSIISLTQVFSLMDTVFRRKFVAFFTSLNSENRPLVRCYYTSLPIYILTPDIGITSTIVHSPKSARLLSFQSYFFAFSIARTLRDSFIVKLSGTHRSLFSIYTSIFFADIANSHLHFWQFGICF